MTLTQPAKEALYSLLLTFAYFLFWLISGYGLNNRPGITGFPLWFEVSCLFLPVIFILCTVLMVRYCYKDIPLDPDHAK